MEFNRGKESAEAVRPASAAPLIVTTEPGATGLARKVAPFCTPFVATAGAIGGRPMLATNPSCSFNPNVDCMTPAVTGKSSDAVLPAIERPVVQFRAMPLAESWLQPPR